MAFFKQLTQRRHHRRRPCPTVSVSVAEEEVNGIGPDNVAGHLVAWNYYQTTEGPANEKFVKAFKAKYGANKVTSDPMEAGYNAVYLWAAAVEKAGTTDVEAVKKAAGGIVVRRARGQGHHRRREPARLQDRPDRRWSQPDGQIKEVWNSGEPIKPDPYLKGYPWAAGLS